MMWELCSLFLELSPLNGGIFPDMRLSVEKTFSDNSTPNQLVTQPTGFVYHSSHSFSAFKTNKSQLKCQFLCRKELQAKH